MLKKFLETSKSRSVAIKELPLKELIFNVMVLIFVIVLVFLPTGFRDNTYPDSMRAVARVLEVNNENVMKTVSFVMEGGAGLQG